MTCYNPKIATLTWVRKLNEKTGEIYQTKEAKFRPAYNWNDVNLETETAIPCGKCEGCLIDKANEWATRACLEAQKWPANAFLTLTYAPEYLPKKRTLKKKDLQDFWKRLRKHLNTEKIRYMACGEYGPKTLRPHYHAVVFNYWPKDAKPYKKNLVGDFLYTSKELEHIWGKGFVVVGHVDYESAAYVARYTFKKAYGADQLPVKLGREKEFRLASRRPGIGDFNWNSELGKKIKRNFGIFVKTKNGITLKKIPEFNKKKWREYDDRQEYYKLAEKYRQRLIEEQKHHQTSDNFYQKNKKSTEILRKKLKKLDKRGNTE